jgi:hypothetical protein
MNDTPAEIAEMVRTRIMALSGAERFMMGIRMCEAARRMVLASLAVDLTPAQRRRAIFERYYGSEMAYPFAD